MKFKLFPMRITVDSKEGLKDNIFYIERTNNIVLEEKVPGKKFLNFLYSRLCGKLLLNSVFANSAVQFFQGHMMDKPFSKLLIKRFIDKYSINMKEALQKREQFASFNDFFVRKLKDNARPIDEHKDSIVSPADGKALVFEKATKSMEFYIKGSKFNLKKFINSDRLAADFQDASMAIIRLAPVDYHRFHFPISCIPSGSTLINGRYYSVSPLAMQRKENVFEKNKREICLLKSEQYSDVLMIEVGATFVGGIVQTYSPYKDTKKGYEKGYFKFGGSTVVLLFKAGSVEFDQDLIINTKRGFETTVKMGESIARFIK